MREGWTVSSESEDVLKRSALRLGMLPPLGRYPADDLGQLSMQALGLRGVGGIEPHPAVEVAADEPGGDHDNDRQIGGRREVISPLESRVKQDHERAHDADKHVESKPRRNR